MIGYTPNPEHELGGSKWRYAWRKDVIVWNGGQYEVFAVGKEYADAFDPLWWCKHAKHAQGHVESLKRGMEDLAKKRN